MTSPRIQPAALRVMLADGEELALVDVREEGTFSGGHLYHAACIALSRLELDIARLVPRTTTRIVLADGGDEVLAGRAAATLARLGWTNVSILAGGLAAWRSAGYEAFTGVNVPSKAFGEYVEHHYGTPSLSADELKARITSGERLVILDSRPLPEFHSMSIPGALDCPGAELAYRVRAAAPDPGVTVIVNCAGRTRSIIGAQSLVNAGIPNPVMALRNGTMGWHLAGHLLDHGKTTMAPVPAGRALDDARASATRVARRFSVQSIDAAGLAAWREACSTRTLYCFDVRDPSEYATGHLPGFASAPGGQLVQATDEFMATRNARVVLADTDGVRAIMTASWLVQMGLPNVRVLSGFGPDQFSDRGEASPNPVAIPRAALISARSLAAGIDGGSLAVVDVGPGDEYRRAHIPGSAWTVRARVAETVAQYASNRSIVFVASDDGLARWAAADLKALAGRDALVLDGGRTSWTNAGQPLVATDPRLLTIMDDQWRKPFDMNDRSEDAMRAYLAWELELVAQLAREGIRFPEFPPA